MATTSACCALFAVAVIFAGVFGWSFSSWQAELDAHNKDLALEKLCTRLRLLPDNDNNTATIAFYGGVECQLKTTVCTDYLLKNGVNMCPGVGPQGRLLSDKNVDARAEFKSWDTDEDGLITANEWLAILHRFGQDTATEAEVQEMIDEVDEDGDGAMNLEEFKDGLGQKAKFDRT